MEYQFQKVSVPCLACAAREYQTQELTQEVRLSDGMPDIGRVIASWGQIIMRSKEWLIGSATVTGGLMVWVLFAPEDGSEPRCVDTWIPFQLRWNMPEIDRDGTLCVSPMLRFVDSRTVSARKIMIRAGVSAVVEAMYPSELSVYQPDAIPEDIQLLRRSYPVRLPKETGEKTFLLDEELSVPESEERPEKLLCYFVQPQPGDRRVMSDKVVFRGNILLHLLHREQSGKLCSRSWEIPYSQFAELDGTYSADAHAVIQMAVTSLELDQNESGLLHLKCSLVAQYQISDKQMLELVEDAYSCRRTLTPQTEMLRLPSVLDEREETLRIEQTLPGVNANVVDAIFLPDYSKKQNTENGISLCNSGMFQVLYYGENDMLQSSNSRWEENMELPVSPNCRLNLDVLPIGEARAVPASDALKLSAEVLLNTTAINESEIPIVTGFEQGELREPDPNRPSLVLRRARGESLWDMAKQYGSTVEQIMCANGLEREPDDDSFLLIPVSQ